MASISIRRTIHILIIAPLITTMGLTGVITFFAGRNLVNDFIEELNNQVSSNIIEHTENYLEHPHVVLEGVLGASKSEIADLNHFPSLEKYMWQLMRQDEEIRFIYYGDEEGRFLGVQRVKQSNQKNEQFYVEVQEKSTPLELKTFLLNEQGKRQELFEVSEYDPRSRPWYQQAKKAKKPTWSPIYHEYTSGVLTISPTVPVYNQQNNLQGVLSIDISLEEIDNFLKKLKQSQNKQSLSLDLEAFIVDREGHLIATSADESLSVSTDRGQMLRKKAFNSEKPIIKSTTKHLLQRFENFNQITNKEFFILDIAGERQLVQIVPINHRENLDWLVVVIIPETNAIMHAVYRYVVFVLLVGIAVTGLAVYVALKMSAWIVKPIRQFDLAVKDIEQQNFEPNSLDEIASRQDEFGQLGRLFQLMAAVVYQRELSLQQQVAKLHQEQEQIKESALITHYKLDRWQRLIAQAKQIRETSHIEH